MTKHGQDLYFNAQLLTQPNHARVERMLHEMQFVPHEDLRHLVAPHQQEHRVDHPSLLDWNDSPTP